MDDNSIAEPTGFNMTTDNTVHPVSCSQKALLELSMRSSRIGAWNASMIVKVRGRLKVERLRAALDYLVARHPVLRTVNAVAPGTMSQRVRADHSCDFQQIDARGWLSGALDRCLAEERKRPFDLERGPLFRARLYSQAEGEHVLLLTAHEIAADRRSFMVLLDGLRKAYAAPTEEVPAAPEPDKAYFEFVRRQRRMLEGGRGRALVSFWSEKLAAGTPALNLPTVRCPQEMPYWDATVHFELSSEIRKSLEAVASSNGRKTSTVLLAAYALLLSRYGNAEDVWIACQTTARDTSELKYVVGNFADFVAVQAECESQLTFLQLLSKVAGSLRSAMEHRDLPFSMLVERPGISRLAGRSPVCDACFVWEDEDSEESAPNPCGVEFAASAMELPAYPFHLGLQLTSSGEAIQGSFLYSKELFEAETIERMSRHFVQLLRAISAGSDAPVSDLDLVPADERELVLGEYAGASAEYPQLCLHELFAQQVALRPDAEAVRYGSERLTYGELDRRSNQIAHLLRGRDVRPGELVGLLMERSVEMIVSMLGIVKAGAAYVPLDPEYPAERLRFMAEDTAVRWILTHRLVDAPLPGPAALVYIDDPGSGVAGFSTEPLPNLATPESVAVLIYTSGSTGRPKGACIPHRAIVRTVMHTNYVCITSEDRVAQLASPSFDVAMYEVWSALTNGAALVGVSRDTLLAPSEMAQVLRAERITSIALNTAHLHQIGNDAPDLLQDVRVVLFGGEAAAPDPIRNILQHGRPEFLINAYGPSEACVTTTCYNIVSLAKDAKSVPIGRPISNARVLVLDSRMRPVGLDIPGEIYIGGDGLALGYWNRAELNAERFVPDPFSSRPGAHLYRTGDFARMRGDGNLEFLGRIDHQVKLRGYRIEIPEVQLSLSAHPCVKNCVVVLREDRPGNKQLTAYVTLRRELESAQENLRSHMANKLPPYMVPTAFVVLKTLPLTVNGKIDTNGLPAPKDRLDAVACASPMTRLESTIAGIWKKLLGLDNVGTRDNFFELGGHSLLAAMLICQIEKETGYNMPVAALFEAPTIEQLARKLEERTYQSAWSPLVDLHGGRSGPGARPFFCVHSLGANLVSYQKLASLIEDRPFYGLQPQGLDGEHGPQQNIEQMAAAYIAAIRARYPQGPYDLGGVCLGGVVAFEMAQQLRAAGEEVGLLVLIDCFMPGPVEYLHVRPVLTQYLDGHLGQLLLLPPAAKLKCVAKWAVNGFIRLASTVGAFRCNDSLSRATRRVMRANTSAVIAYRPEPYAGKITQFVCSDATLRAYEDRRLAWDSVAADGLEVHVVSGDHLSMLEEPHVRTMARKLQSCLARAESRTPSAADGSRVNSLHESIEPDRSAPGPSRRSRANWLSTQRPAST